MEQFRESLLVAISTPVYFLVILLEIGVSSFRKKGWYSVKGTFTNIYLMVLNMGLDILFRGICLVVLDAFFAHHLITWENQLTYWICLLFAQDFMYYLLHVTDHYCRLFWAVHVTHHSSEEFNLTVGFRSSVFQPVYRFIFFIPLALAGFRGIDIMFIYSATQIYGILVHTQSVGKLGFLEWFLVTPSHHRVHHGSNPLYLDKNMGMLFIIWDRMFGTFQEETETVRYGLTTPLESHHPGKVVFHEWQSMVRDFRTSPTVKTGLKYVFYPPGWSHDGSRYTSSQLRRMKGLTRAGYQPSKVSTFTSTPSNTA